MDKRFGLYQSYGNRGSVFGLRLCRWGVGRGFDQGLEAWRWCYVCLFNSVARYRYLLPTVYCLWRISQIQTCLCVVVGPGFVSTSLTFMRSSTSHPTGPHGRLVQKMINLAPIARGRGVYTQFAQQSARTAVTATRLVDCDTYSMFLFLLFYVSLPFILSSSYSMFLFLLF